MYTLYILTCDDQFLYTGITTHLARRLQAHAAGRGAKALRRCGELRLLYQVEVGSRSAAQRLEYRIKQLSRPQKQHIAASNPPLIELCQLLGINLTE